MKFFFSTLLSLFLFLFLLAPTQGIAQTVDIRTMTADQAAPQVEHPSSLFQDAPEFELVPRTSELMVYPCSGCHEYQPPNSKIRPLEMMHGEITLNHGKGQFWCTACHNLTKRDKLISLKRKEISFDNAYLLCGQCHQDRQQDFLFGAHGKRVKNWKGKRTILNCTACHNPHSPQIAKLPTDPAPKPRAGLELKKHPHEKHQKFWPSDFSHLKSKKHAESEKKDANKEEH